MERPFNFPPVYCKRQLPTKYLELAVHVDLPVLERLLADAPEFRYKRVAGIAEYSNLLFCLAAGASRMDLIEIFIEQKTEENLAAF